MTDTQLAQMALSAIIRSGEKVDIITLSEVLRGQNSRAVKVLGLQQIKTFGAGKLWSKEAWFYMLIQMLQQELFVIDYRENHSLKVTEKGHQVLKNEIEIAFQKQIGSSPEKVEDSVLSFKRNGVKIVIESDISEIIDWKLITQSIQSKIYWNYKADMWLNINQYIPRGIDDYEKVKSRLLEIIQEVFNLTIQGDSIFIPKKDDYDIHGVLVEPLKLPFDQCLKMLRDFIEKNGRYPSMKAEADEVALRKWYREAWHRIAPISDYQKDQLMQLREDYPFSQNE